MEYHQINLTGQEIDERLQNVGTAEDVAAAAGTLYARISKNADDIDELNDTVLHIQDAQTATDKTVTQHTADISTLQTAVGNNKTEQDAIAVKVENNAKAIGKHTTTLNDHETRLSDVEDLVYRGLPVYGVEWNVNQTSSDVKRIGIPELHRTLPCHQLRGCLLADNGTVNEYLPQDDWTSATRDGSKGQVMVEIPEMWMKFEVDGDMRRVLLSPVAIGGFKHYQKRYVSAYEATVQRSTNKLASVVNTTEDYRGGDRNKQYDGTEKTMLGKPRTALSQSEFQTSARNRFPNLAWNMYVYDVHCQLTWLFVVEYATLDSQKTYNAELTADGYHQGGLGSGATTIQTWGEWTTVNNNSAFLNCGATDSLGNNTGVVSASVDNLKFNVIRYRGIENPFGHIDKICIGVASNNLFGVWASENPSDFSNLYRDANYKGETPKKSTYISDIIFKDGVTSPKLSTKSTQIFKDYFSNSERETYFIFCVGGRADSQSGAGLFSHQTLLRTSASRARGTRLCYLPQEDNSGTLRDLYISAGAKYNEATGFYELNGLTDITEEEMRKIYILYITNSPKAEHIVSWLSYPDDFRTNIAPRVYYVSNIQNSIGGNSVLEVLVLSASALYIQNSIATAHGSFPKLRRVVGYWVYANNDPSKYNFAYGQPFQNCPLLEEIRMKGINKSHTFAVSTNLSKESVQYMITNAKPLSGAAVGSITITLHPTAYARLKDDADIVAALEAKGGIVTLVSA
jgi:hypothetical protein